MFSNPVLDITIGLVFIYLLYSLLATIIQELIATKLAFRAKILEKAIFRMLEDGKSSNLVQNALAMFLPLNRLKDKRVAAWFYAHPLVKYLGEDNYQSKPSYLSAQNFSKVMLDLLRGSGTVLNEVQQVNDSIQAGRIFHLPVDLLTDSSSPALKALQHQAGGKAALQNRIGDPAATEALNPDTRMFLQTLWQESGAELSLFRLKLEQWFDDTMERATGWYKKHTQNMLLLIGLLLAVSFNVDTIGIVRKLRSDPKLREQLVHSAHAYLEKSNQLYPAGRPLTADQQKDTALLRQHARALYAQADTLLRDDISRVSTLMGLGWHQVKSKTSSYYTPFEQEDNVVRVMLGWLLTALALSLGAPFWFDLLSKLVRLRGAGDKVAAATSRPGTGPAAAPSSIYINTQNADEAVG